MSERAGRPLAWNVAFGASINWALLVGFSRCFGIYYTAIMERFGASNAEAAFVLSVQNGARTITAPCVWLVAQRVGFQGAEILGGALFSLGVIVSVFQPSLTYLYVTMGGISGVGASLLYAVPFMAVNHSFMGAPCHARAMALATAGVGIGTLSFGHIFAFLLAQYGYNGAILISGAILLNFCVAGALLGDPYRKIHAPKSIDLAVQEDTPLLREKHTGNAGIGTDNNAYTPHLENGNAQTENHVLKQNGHVGKDPDDNSGGSRRELENTWRGRMGEWISNLREICTGQLVLYIVSMFFCMIVVLSNLVFLDKLGEELNVPDNGIAFVLMVIGIADLCGRVLSGFLFDIKLARNRKHFFVAVVGLLCGVSALSFGIVRNYEQLLVCGGFYGVIAGGYGAQTITAVVDLVAPEYVHQMVSFTITIQGISMFIGPVLQGWMSDYFHSYAVVYTSSGSALAIVSLATILHYCYQECSARNPKHQKLGES